MKENWHERNQYVNVQIVYINKIFISDFLGNSYEMWPTLLQISFSEINLI